MEVPRCIGAQFEATCQERGIRLFVLPPRSPKLNGCVERAHRTHSEEFYEVYDGDLEIIPLNHALKAWEHIYNTIRPHQAPDTSGEDANGVSSTVPPGVGPPGPIVSYVVDEYTPLK